MLRTVADPTADRRTPDVTLDPEPAPGTPRWVKVLLIVGLLLVLLLFFAKVTGVGGDHGPGRHGGDGIPGADADAGDRAPVGRRP